MKLGARVKAGDKVWFSGHLPGTPAGNYEVLEYNGHYAIVLRAGPANILTVSILECEDERGE